MSIRIWAPVLIGVGWVVFEWYCWRIAKRARQVAAWKHRQKELG